MLPILLAQILNSLKAYLDNVSLKRTVGSPFISWSATPTRITTLELVHLYLGTGAYRRVYTTSMTYGWRLPRRTWHLCRVSQLEAEQY